MALLAICCLIMPLSNEHWKEWGNGNKLNLHHFPEVGIILQNGKGVYLTFKCLIF